MLVLILSQRWPFGAFMCKVVWPFQTVLIAVSVGTLTCMAIERYRAILTPFKTMLSQNAVKIVICAVWCLSVALVAPYIVILEHKDGVCRESWYNEYHPQARNQDFMCVGGGSNEAKADPTTEMYFLSSDPFI